MALIQPCSSNALCLLGNTQLGQYDNDPSASDANIMLEEAKKSYEGAISQEGKPAAGEPPTSVTGMLISANCYLKEKYTQSNLTVKMKDFTILMHMCEKVFF